MARERVISQAPLETDSGGKSAATIRLHTDGQDGTYRATITRDGNTIAYEQRIHGQWEIWIKTLTTGDRHLLIRVNALEQTNATISPDGSQVAFTASDSDVGDGYFVSTAGGTPQQVCDRCTLFGFLGDNRRVLAQADGFHALRIYNRDRTHQDLITSSEGALSRPHLSPDERWLAFRLAVDVSNRTFLAPFTPGHPAPRSSWAQIEEPTTTGRPAGWALDSSILYLLLDTDGFRRLWGQRVDTRNGRPAGTPFPVRHFHGSQAMNVGGVSSAYVNAISTGGFIFEEMNIRGDLWKLTPAQMPR
jgi:WD40-like Beta Propeller Repeat